MAVVITSIQPPTEGVQRIGAGMAGAEHPVYVIGDRKSPTEYRCEGVTYLGMEEQAALGFSLVHAVRENSYTRKMLGYLHAFAQGAQWLRETDDDNLPYDGFFADPAEAMQAREPETSSRWLNPYAYFTDRFIWPRGLPLHTLRDQCAPLGELTEVAGPVVVQALADGDPDVDAIYRLTAPDASDVTFASDPRLLVPVGSWAPFNSQATTWPRALAALMYLPATCSFRMTDIWRSFVAQRIMREVGARLIFTGPTVFQERNVHDLMRDFRDEVEGYVGYDRFIEALNEVSISGLSLSNAMRACYEALCSRELLSGEELRTLDAWISDIRELSLAAVPA